LKSEYKVVLYEAMKVQMGSSGTPSLAGFLDRGGWSMPHLAALPPAKKTGTPC